MYETTIQASPQHAELLQQLAKHMQPFVEQNHGILATLHMPSGEHLSMAVPTKHKLMLQEKLKLKLAELICQHEKYAYFTQNIAFPNANMWWKEAFFLALTQMDQQTDIHMVVSLLKFQTRFSVSSFLYFQMHTLTKRWQEISSLITQNLKALLLTNSTPELVKYIIRSEPKQFQIMHIYLTPSQILLTNQHNISLQTWQNPQDKATQKQVLQTLLQHLPKRMYIHTAPSCAFATFLADLFQDSAYLVHT